MRQGAEQERREEGAQGSDGGGLMTLRPLSGAPRGRKCAGALRRLRRGRPPGEKAQRSATRKPQAAMQSVA